jgi:hypothetical protein
MQHPSSRILLTAAAFVLVAVTFTPRAVACGNADRLEHDDGVKRIAQIEFHLRYEQHWLADQAMPEDAMSFDTAELEERAVELRFALDVRWQKQHISHAVEWFRDARSPERRAWLAEALIEVGHVDEARVILRDLEKRDLMPDGRAHAALARVTQGDEHRAALAKCRKRALVKSVCGAPPRTT